MSSTTTAISLSLFPSMLLSLMFAEPKQITDTYQTRSLFLLSWLMPVGSVFWVCTGGWPLLRASRTFHWKTLRFLIFLLQSLFIRIRGWLELIKTNRIWATLMGFKKCICDDRGDRRDLAFHKHLLMFVILHMPTCFVWVQCPLVATNSFTARRFQTMCNCKILLCVHKPDI